MSSVYVPIHISHIVYLQIQCQYSMLSREIRKYSYLYPKIGIWRTGILVIAKVLIAAFLFCHPNSESDRSITNGSALHLSNRPIIPGFSRSMIDDPVVRPKALANVIPSFSQLILVLYDTDKITMRLSASAP
jgi:hypothetical protein